MSDKISSVLCFVPEICCTSAAAVRWDSDHSGHPGRPLMAIAQELVRGDYLATPHRAGLF